MRHNVPFPVAVIVMGIVTLLIPVMWSIGHRGNNTFLSLCLLFVVFYRLSPGFRDHAHQTVAAISHSPGEIRRRSVVLAAVALMLAVAHLVNNQLCSLWDLDWEGGIGTTYSGFLLAVTTLLCYFCWRRSGTKQEKIAWALFGLLLATMTIDELSEFHHGLAKLVWRITTGQGQSVLIEGLAFWIIVMSPFILAIIAWLAWFVRRVLHRASQLTARVALLSWIASQALEATVGSRLLPHRVEVAAEEFLEMFGAILLYVTFYREYGVRTAPPSREVPGPMSASEQQ